MRTAAPGSHRHDAFAAAAFFTRIPSPDHDGEPSPPGRLLPWGPAVGLVLAAACALPAEAVLQVASGPWNALLAAAVALSASAYLTRGLHLDGLADTCDGLGLGAYRSPAAARKVMHRSDIGAFGAAALMMTVLLQASALAGAAAAGQLWVAMAVAWPAGRLAAVLLCVPRLPAAPGSVLGAWAAGSVAPARAAVLTTAVCAWAGAAAWVSTGSLTAVAGALAAATSSVLVASALGRTARRRFDGITGDVLGAAVEVGQTAALLCLVVALA